jgi:hypothetical protein
MKQIVIFNGPPKSGKDTLTDYLIKNYGNMQHVKYAYSLKQMVHRVYDTPEKHPEAYEKYKDQPLSEFIGLTPRQAYISMSEDYIKKNHGKDFFGLQLILTIKRRNTKEDDVFLVSDGGFDEELEPLLHNFDPSLISVVQLYRKNCSFEGDSRNYFNVERFQSRGVKFIKLVNQANTPEDFIEESISVLKQSLPIIFNSESR